MYSKTHKVDVVSGYNFPNDQHALWFDSATNQLKRFDGGKWVSGSAIDSREESDE